MAGYLFSICALCFFCSVQLDDNDSDHNCNHCVRSNIGVILIHLIIVDYLIHLCMLIGNTLNTEINCHHFLSIFKHKFA